MRSLMDLLQSSLKLGVSGAGSIKSEQYQGVLRSDLAAALKSNSDCSLRFSIRFRPSS